MNFQIVRSGRKRKPGVMRDSSGKSRGEPEHAIKAVAWAYRSREVGDEQKDNALAGFTLGRLKLFGERSVGNRDPGGISEQQFDAGWKYAEIVRRHSAIMGYSIGSPKSPGFEMVSTGSSLREDPDEKMILDARRAFNNCYSALIEAGVALGQGVKVATITYDACMDRKSAADLMTEYGAMGNLKIGLNALSRVFR